MDEYERKFQTAMNELEAAGVWRSSANPFATYLLRKIGLQPRPPHYASFLKTALGQGMWFFLVWGVFMWFFVWSPQGLPIGKAITTSALAGILFGVAMGLYYGISRMRHNLSDWQDF